MQAHIPKFAKMLIFYLYVRIDRWRSGLCPRPHSNCCLSLYLNIAVVRQGPGNMLLVSWESPGNFCNQESGNPVTADKYKSQNNPTFLVGIVLFDAVSDVSC